MEETSANVDGMNLGQLKEERSPRLEVIMRSDDGLNTSIDSRTDADQPERVVEEISDSEDDTTDSQTGTIFLSSLNNSLEQITLFCKVYE